MRAIYYQLIVCAIKKAMKKRKPIGFSSSKKNMITQNTEVRTTYIFFSYIRIPNTLEKTNREKK